MTSRRDFLVLTGATVLVPSFLRASERSPALLDHVILGCNDLDTGIRFVQERTGIQAVQGGSHPDRGTSNALLSLGERRYLEIVAPTPNGKPVQAWAARQLEVLKGLTSPRLMGWAVHPNDIDGLAQKFRQSGIEILGPWPGSRVRPDGQVISWKNFSLADDRHGLLPFFIAWSANAVHPSSDAPSGCHIEYFAVAEPDTAELTKALRRIEVDAPVEQSEKPQLRARIIGPKGALEVTS